MNPNLSKLKSLLQKSQAVKSGSRNQFKTPVPQALTHDMKQQQAQAKVGMLKPQLQTLKQPKVPLPKMPTPKGVKAK